eukprot:1158274-Pelagomonas_calceolata.AAC.14
MQTKQDRQTASQHQRTDACVMSSLHTHLQGHIQGDLRDGEPHAVQVPRLTNELDEVCVEVDLHTARHDGFDEDGLLEVLHRNGVDGVAPRAEQLLLIEHDGLGKAAELGLHVAADFWKGACNHSAVFTMHSSQETLDIAEDAHLWHSSRHV